MHLNFRRELRALRRQDQAERERRGLWPARRAHTLRRRAKRAPADERVVVQRCTRPPPVLGDIVMKSPKHLNIQQVPSRAPAKNQG